MAAVGIALVGSVHLPMHGEVAVQVVRLGEVVAQVVRLVTVRVVLIGGEDDQEEPR